MKLVKLGDFQKMAGLSDRALSWLLTRNLLRCEIDPETGLMVDMDSVEIGALLKSIGAEHTQVMTSGERLLMERLASVATRRFEEVIDRTLNLLAPTHEEEK